VTGDIPIKWSAPEVLLSDIYTLESDIWSFGITLWECMSYGTAPFSGLNNEAAKATILKGGRLEQPPECPSETYQLMHRCWAVEVDQRPKFEAIHQELQLQWERRKDLTPSVVSEEMYADARVLV